MTPRHLVLGILASSCLVALVGCGDNSTGTNDNNQNNANPVCGNGAQEGAEECDGADLGGETCQSQGLPGGTLACYGNCTFDTTQCDPPVTCGNGAVDAMEQCDGSLLNGQTCITLGYSSGTLTCAANCQFNESQCNMGPECGDGNVDAGEQCDGSNLDGQTCLSRGHASGTLACAPATCQFDESGCVPAPDCGNGLIDANEQCDGANLNSQTCSLQGFDSGPLGCSGGCQFDTSGCYSCGDGVLNGVEDCDGADLGGQTCVALGSGYTGGLLGCTVSCIYDTASCATCGNGVLEPTEACEDGNAIDWDGCMDCAVSEFQVNTTTAGSQRLPSVAALPDGSLVYVWTSPDGDGDGVFLRILGPNGGFVSGEIQVSDVTAGDQSGGTVAAWDDGTFVVVWDHGETWGHLTYFRRFDSSGNPLGVPTLVNTPGEYGTICPLYTRPIAISPGGQLLVAFNLDGVDGDREGAFLRRFHADGTPAGSRVQVNTSTWWNQTCPGVSVSSNGSHLVTWHGPDADGPGIFAQRYDASGIPEGMEFQVNTQTVDWQRFANSTYLPDGSFIITWDDWFLDEFIGRKFDATGAPLTGEVILTSNAFGGGARVRSLPSGDILVPYEGLDGNAIGVFTRYFTSSLVPLGPAQQLNLFTTDYQAKPLISFLPDNRFSVVWQSYSQDGDNNGVFAQRFSPTGLAVGVLPW